MGLEGPCLGGQMNINLIHGGGGGEFHPLPFNSPFRSPAPSHLIIIPQTLNHSYSKKLSLANNCALFT